MSLTFQLCIRCPTYSTPTGLGRPTTTHCHSRSRYYPRQKKSIVNQSLRLNKLNRADSMAETENCSTRWPGEDATLTTLSTLPRTLKTPQQPQRPSIKNTQKRPVCRYNYKNKFGLQQQTRKTTTTRTIIGQKRQASRVGLDGIHNVTSYAKPSRCLRFRGGQCDGSHGRQALWLSQGP